MSNRNKEQKSVEGHYYTQMKGITPYEFIYELPFSLKDKVFQIELETIGRLWVWEEDGPETEYDWSQNGIDSDFEDPDVLEVRFVESKVSTDV